MAEVPEIQVLEKEKYFTQALVRLPDALPLPPLGPSSVRLRTEAFSLTVNNFTYAKLGSLLGWWGAHPLPASAPAPHNDAARYGRTNCWGYARVLESTYPGAGAGSYVWGYLPIGTLPLDLAVRQDGDLGDQISATDAYRQKLMPIYNKYRVYPESLGREIQRKDEGIAYDALIGVMHFTAYLMNKFVFAADPEETLSPAQADQPWSPEQADIAGAIVISFAPGSKVGLAFAHLLRSERPAAAQPRAVIGAASERSRAFVEGTGLYDEVVVSTTTTTTTTTSGDGSDDGDDNDPAAAIARILEKYPQTGSSSSGSRKVVIFDFGGRAGAAPWWAQAIRPLLEARGKTLTYVGVGSEIEERSTAEVLRGLQAGAGAGGVRVNADDMRARAIAKVGFREFRDGLDRSWEAFKAKGVKGFKPRWGEGMESAIKGWDELAKGEVGPDEGLVFKI